MPLSRESFNREDKKDSRAQYVACSITKYENVKLKDKTISKLKDRIQEIIKQLVLLCKS